MNDYLMREDHTPARAPYPIIDAHNHLWGDWDNVGRFVEVMDAVNVGCYCDLTANLRLQWIEGGYTFSPGNIADFFAHTSQHPHRFYGFTMADFTSPPNEPLFSDADAFAERCVETLTHDVARGARGLKILKELGLHYRDADGQLIRVDDERLAPIWEAAGNLGVPVLIHQSDPYAFFQPVTPENEHYGSLQKYPTWSFCGDRFPSKEELLQRRDRLLRNHPGTTFLLPHVANFAENLAAVSELLDTHANVAIDFSARCDELGRQPYTARDFIIRHQDRVYFGTDMPPSVEMYRFHFRFLQTWDEFIVPPDYDGTFGRYRWRVHGLGLPGEVLRKLYVDNALRLIPGLRDDYHAVTQTREQP